MNLRNQASAIHEVLPPRSFTFLHDACRALEQARKVVAVGEADGRGMPRGLSGLGRRSRKRGSGSGVAGASGWMH